MVDEAIRWEGIRPETRAILINIADTPKNEDISGLMQNLMTNIRDYSIELKRRIKVESDIAHYAHFHCKGSLWYIPVQAHQAAA